MAAFTRPEHENLHLYGRRTPHKQSENITNVYSMYIYIIIIYIYIISIYIYIIDSVEKRKQRTQYQWHLNFSTKEAAKSLELSTANPIFAVWETPWGLLRALWVVGEKVRLLSTLGISRILMDTARGPVMSSASLPYLSNSSPIATMIYIYKQP